jgi:hypothetical protein
MQSQTPNPTLSNLEALVGKWSLEILFPADPASPLRGSVSSERLEGRAFLVMRSGIDWSGPSGSVAVIGRDDKAETYSMLYFDARGVSRIYEMSFGDGVWKQ